MKQRRIIIVAVLALLFAGSGFVIASNMSERQDAAKYSAVDKNGNRVLNVSLNNGRATPDTITVLKGHTVRFIAADGKTHKLAEGEGNAEGHGHDHKSSFNSGEFGAGEAWEVQFKKNGSYFLHDHEDPNINVLVVVYEKKT